MKPKTEIIKWIHAIERCLEQEKYGGAVGKCELCIESGNGCSVPIGTCRKCICRDYRDHLLIKGNLQDCVLILMSPLNPIPFLSWNLWSVGWVRLHLRLMLNWLKEERS